MIDTRDLEFIGDGAFGQVYRLDEHHVIKILFETGRHAVEREIEGGNRPGCLPVLRTMRVRHAGKFRTAMVKEYIPYVLQDSDWPLARKFEKEYRYYDIRPDNLGFASNGRLVMFDTGMPGIRPA